MDMEKFIDLVHQNKCLWDQSEATYHVREHQRNAWGEISSTMDIPVDELKKRWKGIRDTFVKELKKVNSKRSGQTTDAETESKWPYFKCLSFLIGSTAFLGQLGEQNEEQIPKKTVKAPLKRKLKKKSPDEATHTQHPKLLEMEEEKSRLLQQLASDPDAQFLMSLLPFLKDVPKYRKLIVRSNLQQVLLDEQNQMSNLAHMDYPIDVKYPID